MGKRRSLSERRPLTGSATVAPWKGFNILVVEDDEHVAIALESVLTRYGFHVVAARDGASTISSLNNDIDLVLLDLGLPDMDGFVVCQEIRRRTDIPVIMATARSGVAHRIRGLELGADDYITKPYDLREVLARIQTVLRRGPLADNETQADQHFVEFTINFTRREVRLPDDTLALLTRKEFDLLAVLVTRRNTVVPRERILHEVWGTSRKELERTLEVHIAALRRKLRQADTVRTVRGVGYRLDVTEGDG